MATLLEFYKDCLSRLESGAELALATIVRHQGSVPRGTGAQMILDNQGGALNGTVGGGAIEAAVLREMKHLLQYPDAQEVFSDEEEKTLQRKAYACEQNHEGALLLLYRLRPNEIADLGMICGGDADVLIQVLDSKSCTLLRQLVRGLQESQKLSLILDSRRNGLALLKGKELIEQAASFSLETEILSKPDEMNWYKPQFHLPLRMQLRTILFGGGHVSQAVMNTAKDMDMRWVVFEDRPEFLKAELFPQAEQLILGDYERIEDQLTLGDQDQVCILTRGHKFDYPVVVHALKTNARYIGMMGSRRKIYSTFQKLQKEGFTAEDLARLHAPIGLDIGAQTPAEIAISILAELLQDRYGKDKRRKTKVQIPGEGRMN